MAIAEEVQVEGVPLTDSEKQIWADIEWADHDEEVQAKYAGQWVALYQRAVVAHGTDRAQVLREAAAVTQRPTEELAIWPILSGAAFLSDCPPSASEI